MATIFINYADRLFLRAQQLGIRTASLIGGFDKAIAMGRRDLDAQFSARNRDILDDPRGAGYWLWKPYIVLKTVRETMAEGDVLFYADAGCHFVRDAAPAIDMCRRQADDKPFVFFSLDPAAVSRVWTKRDCFFYMGLDRTPYLDAQQVAGTFLVCRKTGATAEFLEEWLRCCEDARLLTDAPNVCGLPDYPGFRNHRNDQSILSLLVAKHGMATVPDISQWGDGRRPPEMPQIVAHTRWTE